MSRFGGGGEGTGELGGKEGSASATAARPEVSPETLWKERAEEWEKEAGALRARIAELERTLTEARATADAAERRRTMERLLTEADAIDLETALLLTEAAVGGMDEPDVSLAVREVRERKPFLFGRGAGGIGGGVGRGVGRGAAMAAADDGLDAAELLEEIAAEARESGDRRALLRYLRERRRG